MSEEYVLVDDIDNKCAQLFLSALKEQIPSVIIKINNNVMTINTDANTDTAVTDNIELMFIQLTAQINILHKYGLVFIGYDLNNIKCIDGIPVQLSLSLLEPLNADGTIDITYPFSSDLYCGLKMKKMVIIPSRINGIDNIRNGLVSLIKNYVSNDSFIMPWLKT